MGDYCWLPASHNTSLYLVTGGAGFIGSNTVERLVQQGERACPACPEHSRRERRRRVRVLDNLSTGKRENLTPWLDRIELIEGDIRDPETVRRAMAGVDYVLHQAALPSVSLRQTQDRLLGMTMPE